MFFALSGSLKFVMLKFIDSVVSRKVVITIFAGNLSGFSFFSHCLLWLSEMVFLLVYDDWLLWMFIIIAFDDSFSWLCILINVFYCLIVYYLLIITYLSWFLALSVFNFLDISNFLHWVYFKFGSLYFCFGFAVYFFFSCFSVDALVIHTIV